jgi:hypothetical protein
LFGMSTVLTPVITFAINSPSAGAKWNASGQ